MCQEENNNLIFLWQDTSPMPIYVLYTAITIEWVDQVSMCGKQSTWKYNTLEECRQ